jgi:hypothetical protein
MTERQLENFALSWHAGLFVGHAAAIAYNAIRGNRKWVALHIAMALVEAKAVVNHVLEENGSLR